MRAMVKIGYMSFLCKSETDAAQILKLMSRTLRSENYYLHSSNPDIVISRQQVEIEMMLVRDNVKVVMEGAESEVAPETKKKLKQIGRGQPMLMLTDGR